MNGLSLTLLILTAVVAVVTLLPLSRFSHWAIRGWDFPRLQLSVVSLALLVANFSLAEVNDWWWLVILSQCLCLAYHSAWILPYTQLLPSQVKRLARLPQAQRQSASHIRVMCANVLESNRRSKRLLEIVHKQRPDILVAVETDDWWMDELDELTDDYPHVLRCPQDNLYGMLVYSVWPLEDASIEYIVQDGIPSMHFQLNLPGDHRIAMHCVHPAPPSPIENTFSLPRDAELVKLASRVQDCSLPVIVAGDLNDVAWSRTTRLFRKISGLLDPRLGRGAYNTFHAKVPFLRWPLDHVFHSEHFALVEMKRLPAFGSDHFPILIELALLAEAPAQQTPEQSTAEQRQEAADIVAREAAMSE
ncbi:endonuclease/exonuclease/phosphatase family protein [Idiomarina xiamenensis]|uniref:Endonuclease/exonuclease/phosphatase domain-containing protein n=1 Tax=Idiomarina xiamenensis 10-D-4 TaxID=740709 RepID=K2JLU4_9GAMM|nr:endonuclease/exonuclease/phosphatase family protein [Idiomarina xiamenensis]EKE84481.1 hypothetical protein A10D4_05417 [Idiomarina xiamenensis 10-D-4]